MSDRKSSVFSLQDKRFSSGSGGQALKELLRDKAVGGWSQAPGVQASCSRLRSWTLPWGGTRESPKGAEPVRDVLTLMFRKDHASGTADDGEDGVRLGSRRNSPCRNVETRAQQGWWDEGVCAAGQHRSRYLG